MKGLNWRITTVVATVLFAIYLLIPTFLKFAFNKQVPKVIKSGDPFYYHLLPSQVLKLGLDLRGGVHLVMGIDFAEVKKDAVVKMKTQLEDLLKEEKVQGVTIKVMGINRILINFESDEQWEKVDSIIGRYLGPDIDFAGQTEKSASLVLSSAYHKRINDGAVQQSLETLRNRVDEFGIAEPIIQKHGEDKILVQFPGVSDIRRVKEIIARTAKLSFQIVVSGPDISDATPSLSQLNRWVDQFIKAKTLKLSETQPISSYLRPLNAYLQGKLPDGTEILFHKQTNINTKEVEYTPYLLEQKVMVTGEDLDDARQGYDPETGDPRVNFSLKPLGASKFEKATGENIGRHMAIVLDNNVHSAPVIRSRIGGGQAVIELGTIGRPLSEVIKDATDTALVLRSGALPARLEFLEERTIGPSLGADSIRAGTISLAVGLAMVLLFMIIYYRTSGFIAVLALVLNGLFVLAALAAFEGTLTLPGFAGITLVVGMAVDANVLIFEHIREELRLGKGVNLAIAEGYRRAFSAIFDSNLTTIIAAIVLFNFGYGPIRGFAVTLLIGLMASMYTAIFVTRTVVDYTIVSKGKQTISV